MIQSDSVSIIVPTFNGGHRISKCLEALISQTGGKRAEIIVVDDGSTDGTYGVVSAHPGVRVIRQENAGPAAARNRGANDAQGDILLFTDDDCVPNSDWLLSMLAPFADPNVVGAKGVYMTRQHQLTARFVQLEYEDKYRNLARVENIDFIDTYSAAFRRKQFLEVKGYDTSFPVACAEDVELSFRMSAKGWVMKFVPDAAVYHTHPSSLGWYLRKKYKFAFWRMYAVSKNPEKAVKDSHTPQLMKFQLLLLPLLLSAFIVDLLLREKFLLSAVIIVGYYLTTIPFSFRNMRKDPAVAIVSPLFLAARSCAQFLGVLGGTIYVWQQKRSVHRLS